LDIHEEDKMILKLIGMIILGIISALLSYYNKNYYVRLFNDILGRDEDESAAVRTGRGFYYGFFFPIYFSLVLTGIVALIAFLIVAGICAAIVFVLVWVTEKILPQPWIGNGLLNLFSKVGISRPPTEPFRPAPQEEKPEGSSQP
jgi:hypothetical protein